MSKTKPKKTPKKANGADSKTGWDIPNKKANVAVEAVFGDSRGIPDDPAIVIIDEEYFGFSRTENTLEVMVIVPKPDAPKEPLLEVITPEVIPPVVELIMTESLVPNLPSVMLIDAESDFDLYPEDNEFIEVGEITVICQSWIKTLLEDDNVDIKRDIGNAIQVVMRSGDHDE